MDTTLTQAEIEWLRCLDVTTRMTPRLPLDIQRKLETRLLIEARAGSLVVTESGRQLLRHR